MIVMHPSRAKVKKTITHFAVDADSAKRTPSVERLRLPGLTGARDEFRLAGSVGGAVTAASGTRSPAGLELKEQETNATAPNIRSASPTAS